MTPGTGPALRLCLVVSTIVLVVTNALQETPLRMPGIETDNPDTYLCMSTKLDPSGESHYIVGYEPHGSMKTAHHILVYGCKTPGAQEKVWNCGEMNGGDASYRQGPVCSTGSQILYAWAKDAPELELPEGVGFKVGGDSGIDYIVVQVHYMHPMTEPDYSGVTVHSTEEVQPKRAAVLLMVTDGRIGPKTKEHFETACVIDEATVLHPIKFRTHTHKLGRVVSGWKVVRKNNGKDNWKLIGKHNPQDPQMFYDVSDPAMTIGEGDIVAARCFMENDGDSTVSVGATGKDEMCNFYMMYYVEGDKILRDNTCFSPGPPNYYWKEQGGLNSIPDKAADTV